MRAVQVGGGSHVNAWMAGHRAEHHGPGAPEANHADAQMRRPPHGRHLRIVDATPAVGNGAIAHNVTVLLEDSGRYTLSTSSIASRLGPLSITARVLPSG